MLVLRTAADRQNQVLELDGWHTAPTASIDLGA
jgi:hypothetical protein